MNHRGISVIRKLHPAVPRHYLFAVAGALWTVAGGLLCMRAVVWLGALPIRTEFALESASLILAAAGYSFLFSRVVQRNIDRIRDLPERACVFAFTAWRGYLLIAFMVTAGITLRKSSIPLPVLSVPYTAMGVVLLTGSVSFYRQFLAAHLREKS